MEFLRVEKKLSERRASRVIGVSRRVIRYRSTREEDQKVREAIRRLAFRHRRWGYRTIWRRLRLDGWVVNHKRIERIYKAEKLSLRRKRRKKTPAHLRVALPKVDRPNICWSADFVSDATVSGRAIRGFVLEDDYSRRCLALKMSYSIPGRRVVEYLEEVARERGYPRYLRVDNGPEFRGADLRLWASTHGVQIVFIEPGKPMQNGFVESLNARVREHFLNESLFIAERDAQTKADAFFNEYNWIRPHSASGLPPAVFEDNQLVNEGETLIRTGTK